MMTLISNVWSWNIGLERRKRNGENSKCMLGFDKMIPKILTLKVSGRNKLKKKLEEEQ